MFERTIIACAAVLATASLTCDKPSSEAIKPIAPAVPVANAAPLVLPTPAPEPTSAHVVTPSTIRIAKGQVDLPGEMKIGDRADVLARQIAPMLESGDAGPTVSDARATLTEIKSADDGPVGVFAIAATTTQRNKTVTRWTGTANVRARDGVVGLVDVHGDVAGGGTRSFRHTYSSSSH